MAIRSKIKPDEYGKDAKNPLQADEIKPEAYSAVQKLAKKGMKVKTPFFLHTEYYEGGEPFLAIGESSGLEKKFKKEKTSDTVAFGNLYLEEEDGDEVVCFEYVSGQGKFKKETEWEKLFKVVKKWFKRECKMVIEGEEEEETPKETKEEKDSSEPSTKTPKGAKALVEDVKELNSAYKHITKEQHEPDNVRKLYKLLANWLKNYEQLTKEEQQKLNNYKEHIDELVEGTKRQLRRDKVLNHELDEVIELVDAYADDFDGKKREQLLKSLEGIDKLAKALNDYEILEQTKELRGLLESEVFH